MFQAANVITLRNVDRNI